MIEMFVCFVIFLLVQSLFINGVHYCFEKDNIFYKIKPSFFDKHKKEKTWWTMPLWGCVRCMASVYGFATFWPFVIDIFGFHSIEPFVFVMDVFALVTLNWIIYRKT
jgi:hypothetical protein